MQWQVIIPGDEKGSAATEVHVDAENWLSALRLGLQKCGITGQVFSNISCNIKPDQSVEVRDYVTNKVFLLRPGGEAPRASAAPAPTAPRKSHPVDFGTTPALIKDLPSHELFYTRDEVPDDGSDICFRERLIAIAPKQSRDDAAQLVQAYFMQAKAMGGIDGAKLFVSVQVFDHKFSEQSQRPAVAALTWKQWSPRAPRVIFPLSGSQAISLALSQPPAPATEEETTEHPKPTATEPVKAHTKPPAATEPVKAHTKPPAAYEPVKAHSKPPAAYEPVKAHTKPPAAYELLKAHSKPPAATEQAKAHSKPPAATVQAKAHSKPPAATVQASPGRAPLSLEHPRPLPPLAVAAPPISPFVTATAPEPELVIDLTALKPKSEPPVAAPPPAPMPPQHEAPRVERHSSSPKHKATRAMGIDDRMVVAFERMHEIFGISDHDQAARFVIELCHELVEAEAASCMLISPGQYELYIAAATGSAKDMLLGRRISFTKGIVGFATRTSSVITCSDPVGDPRFDQTFDTVSGFETRNILVAPICFEGHTLGAIELINSPKSAGFSQDDANILSYVGGSFGEFIQTSLPSREAEFSDRDFTSFEHRQVAFSPTAGQPANYAPISQTPPPVPSFAKNEHAPAGVKKSQAPSLR
ncbi:MAG: GAF domain-containing protein [Myxococcota bacterium]|nr:GAF domain-containing protein [Myxococcota bacterium]